MWPLKLLVEVAELVGLLLALVPDLFRPLPRLPRGPRPALFLGFAGLVEPREEVLAALEPELGTLEGGAVLLM